METMSMMKRKDFLIAAALQIAATHVSKNSKIDPAGDAQAQLTSPGGQAEVRLVYELAKEYYNTMVADCIPDSPGVWPGLPDDGVAGVQGGLQIGSNVLAAITDGLTAVPGAGPLAPAIIEVIKKALGAGAQPASPPIAATTGS